VLATYGESFYTGRPALTRHNFGKGRAYYLATFPEPVALGQLARHLCAEQSISPALAQVPGLEIVPRVTPAGETQYYVLNHTDEPIVFALPALEFIDLISNQIFRVECQIPALGVCILQAVAKPDFIESSHDQRSRDA